MYFMIALESERKKTAFGVVVPDLPGCFSAGDTIEEAFDNAREAIDAFCELLAEDKKDLPNPKPMSQWQAEKGYTGWAWGIIDVPVERYFGPAEKINITVPAGVLRQIDSFAKTQGTNRSAFLTQAALDAIRRAG
jgi:predicted RNase H-like HicB family nuclease